jgi:hypothetical protein
MTGDATPTSNTATNSGSTPPVPGTTTAGGGGTPPVAGADANATTKELAAGTKAKLSGTVPAELVGKQARFAQLPSDVQELVAKAFGSDQGAAAFKADQLVAFNANGEVALVEGGTIYLKHQAQVRGAGPGEDLAMTVRPGRQPGGASRTSGGGGSATTTSVPTAANGSAHDHHATAASSTNGTRPVTGGGSTANRIELFKPGGEIRNVAFGGVNGSFSWKTLPAAVKAAILSHLTNGTTAPAQAFQSRTGSGWSIDPNAMIVMEAGFAQFVNGLALVRSTATAPVSGGGASSQPVGHDATQPPVSGGGGTGIGSVAPGSAPPVPVVNEPAEHADGHHHTH